MNGRQRGMAVKTDINKQGWQKSDFPVACQKCYGQNPYMRMLKENYGQQCRLCFRPFTVFKWKGDRGIYKRTCICNSCSKQKNLCQVCTLDLQFGLPMQIRNKRCGQNGKYLLNQNFINQTTKKVKPPPPSSAPPVPKNAYQQKEAVYIPQKQDSQSDQQNVQKKQQINQKQINNQIDLKQQINNDNNNEQKENQPNFQQKQIENGNLNIIITQNTN